MPAASKFDRMINRCLVGLSLLAAIFALLCLLTGCFVIKAAQGDPEKRRPDASLPELTIPTNSFLLTNAPPIR